MIFFIYFQTNFIHFPKLHRKSKKVITLIMNKKKSKKKENQIIESYWSCWTFPFWMAWNTPLWLSTRWYGTDSVQNNAVKYLSIFLLRMIQNHNNVFPFMSIHRFFTHVCVPTLFSGILILYLCSSVCQRYSMHACKS